MKQHQGWQSWRLGALFVGGVFICLPIMMLLIEVTLAPSAWKVWSEWDRLLGLLVNTIIIATGSSLLALLLGGPVAILLARTRLWGRFTWGILLGTSLFVPLPMLMSGWYLLAQTFGAPLPALWPWEARWLGTILLHGLLGIPWVVLLTGLGLTWVEPELEEEMLLYASFPKVLRHILMPRCWPFVGMSLILVSWPTWHEITVTDFFKVRTIAEEVYLQLNGGSMEDGARALAAVIPFAVLMVLVSLWAMRYWREHCPPAWPSNRRLRLLPLGSWQLPAQLWMLLVITLVLIVPLIGIVQRAGIDYQPSGAVWRPGLLIQRVSKVINPNARGGSVESSSGDSAKEDPGNLPSRSDRQQSNILNQSLRMSFLAGLLTSGMVMIAVWLARGSRRIESIFWWLAALLWSIPGPLLGLGLLSSIQLLIYVPGLTGWLYSSPSPLPNIWSALLRFLPLAWLALWPVARLIPIRLEESVILDGASPWQRFRLLYWPRLWKPALGLALAVSLMTLGEISAGKLVTTPGYLPLSHHLFQQLHAGADTEVAALSIVLCLPALSVALVVFVHSLFQFRQRD